VSTSRLLFLAALALALFALVLRYEQHRPASSAVVADAVRTPGILNPDVTQATIASTICKHGWTRTIRPPTDYTDALKLKQMREYGLTGRPQDYQEDHLISLELGGDPVDPRNLWPEPYPRASHVDQMENDLNAKVCHGALALADAQEQESALKHRDG
jgi:hypothetical protein